MGLWDLGDVVMDAAVLVYRTNEAGDHLARSTSAPNERQSEVKTVAGPTFGPVQSKRLNVQAHNSIFDHVSPPAADASRPTKPAMPGDRSLGWLSSSASLPLTAVGLKETTSINSPAAKPELISRSITAGLGNRGTTAQIGSNDGRGSSLDLLNSYTAGKRSEPLPLALGGYKNSPSASVAAVSPVAPDSAVNVVSRQSPANGALSRQMAAVAPRPQVAAGLAGSESVGRSVAQRVSETAATEEKKQRPFDASEIEFMASKVYSYIKQKLVIEKERHGRPGVSWWR